MAAFLGAFGGAAGGALVCGHKQMTLYQHICIVTVLTVHFTAAIHASTILTFLFCISACHGVAVFCSTGGGSLLVPSSYIHT